MVDFTDKYGGSMITEKLLTDVGDQVVKDYIEDDRYSDFSGRIFKTILLTMINYINCGV